MLLALAIFADSTVEAISGGGGWVGAGLLGLVLSWLLFKHLPDKDRQMEKFIKDKDQQLLDQVTRHENAVKEITKTFEAALQTVMNHCRDETERIVDAFRLELKNFREGKP